MPRRRRKGGRYGWGCLKLIWKNPRTLPRLFSTTTPRNPRRLLQNTREDAIAGVCRAGITKKCDVEGEGRGGNIVTGKRDIHLKRDMIRRWRYLFSKYLTPSAAYLVTNTIRKRGQPREATCVPYQLFYLFLGGI